MKYIEVTIEIDTDNMEDVLEALAERGITDVEIIDPEEIREMLRNTDPTEYADEEEFEDDLAAKPSVRYYMPLDSGDSGTSGGADPFVTELYGDNVSTRIVDDADWKDKWKEFFVPTRVSEKIWVTPSWTKFEPPSDGPGTVPQQVISIDPGMAFGTGTHETTYLTMQLLEKYMKPGCRVLDVGCGSGILAIAAVKLGAGYALGIDIDPEAVRAARENAELNGVKDKVEIIEGDLTSPLERGLGSGGGYGADIVAANLLTDLVLSLSGHVTGHLAPQGVFISSGILEEHLPRVQSHLCACGYRVLETVTAGGWCAVAADR